MNSLSVVLVFCLAVTAYGFPDSKIVGGKDAPNGMFPYQVSLRKNKNHFCGGSIIDSRIILTAAHCVEGLSNLNGITVQVGTNQLNSGGESYVPEKVVAHSGFNSLSLVNDIALIRLNQDISFNNLVKSIQLASGTNTYEGSSCVLSGWGTIRLNGNVPNNLQYINLVIEKQSECKKAHWRVQSSHICTFTKYGEGACHGDSGGPLVVNGVQVGIVSFGQPCAVGKPDVYTRVSSFSSWIKEHKSFLMEEKSEAPADGVYIS